MKIYSSMQNLWKLATGKSAPYGKQIGKTAADGAKTYLKGDTFTCVNADGSIRKTVQHTKNSAYYNIDNPQNKDVDGFVGTYKTVYSDRLNRIIKKATYKTISEKGLHKSVPTEATNLTRTADGRTFMLRATDTPPKKGAYDSVFANSSGLKYWQYSIDSTPVGSGTFRVELQTSGNKAQYETFFQ